MYYRTSLIKILLEVGSSRCVTVGRCCLTSTAKRDMKLITVCHCRLTSQSTQLSLLAMPTLNFIWTTNCDNLRGKKLIGAYIYIYIPHLNTNSMIC